jgi:hypothetical protein
MSEAPVKNQILVVDVPSTISAEDAEQMLNAVCEQGYFLRTITPESRAYFELCYTLPEKRTGKVAGHAIAAIQQRIERVLKSKGPLGRRQLHQFTNGRRDDTADWDRALERLVRGQLARVTDGKFFWADMED